MNKNNSVCIVIIVALIGLFIMLTPVILKNEKIRNFTLDRFNLVLLIFMSIVLCLFDMRIGAVYTILLLSFLSYAKLEKFSFLNPRFYNENKEPIDYKKQFKLLSNDTPAEHNTHFGIESFNDCNKHENPSDEKFESTNFQAVNENNNTSTDYSTVAKSGDTLTNNLPNYMNQLKNDPLTNKLKNETYNYDTVSCRYDMVDTVQTTTENGPPVGWNNTYDNKTVNGISFYPLTG